MNKKKALIGGLTIWIIFLLSGLAFLTSRYSGNLSVQQTKAAIEGFGILAPVVFVGMCVLRGLIFLPCGMFSVLGGAIFGKLGGTIFTLLGLTAGSVLTFYLARILGKDWAKRTMGHCYDRYEGYVSKDFPYSIFFMRALPILPFDVVSCIAGISRVSLGKFVSGTLAGSLPGVFIYVYFGDSIRSMSVKRVVFSIAIILFIAVLPFVYSYLTKSKLKST